jgi:hypothetical protein
MSHRNARCNRGGGGQRHCTRIPLIQHPWDWNKYWIIKYSRLSDNTHNTAVLAWPCINIQPSNDTVCSHALISAIISVLEFPTADWGNPMGHGSYVSRNAQTAISPSPLPGLWPECLGLKEVAGQILDREQFWNNSWPPLHDNVPACCILSLKQFLASNWCVIQHPPYLLDLALIDFSLFPKVKLALKWGHFSNI